MRASWRQRPFRSRRRCVGRVAVALAGWLAAACGFQPMYGERERDATPVSSDLASIEVGLIPDRAGQLLRNRLTRLLNPGSEADTPRRYTLSVALRERLDTFAVERSGFATRANVEVTATYTLIDDPTGNSILAGNSRAVSSFNILDNDFSTYVASGDAVDRAVDQLAFDIRNRLAAHFSRSLRPGADPT